MSFLTVSDTNPNEVTGGGGCVVCGPNKDPDQHGPFVIVTNDNEMESNLSPHVVLCRTCIERATLTLSEEILSAGEQMEQQVEELAELLEALVDDEDEEVPDL